MRRFALGCAALLALACGAPPASPEATVRAYFRGLGRDPVRSFLLLDDAYHRTHGLTVPLENEPPDPDAPGALAAAQVGWLDIQKQGRDLGTKLVITGLESDQDGDRATVRARVAAPDVPAFDQVFDLTRGEPGGGWRITAISQRGLERANWTAAFIAAPSLDGYRRILRLERARERR